MEKVFLTLFDTRCFEVEDLVKILSINENGFLESRNSNKLKNNESLVSKYIKNHIIKDYYFNEFGKPCSENIFFNISHSEGVVCLVTSSKNCGIDIENHCRTSIFLKKRHFTEEENQYSTTNEKIIELWVSKESLLKCVGVGITEQLSLVPSLPTNGLKIYKERTYFSKIITYKDYLVSITLEDNQDFDIVIKDFLK